VAQVVEPDEMADLIRRLAEVAGVARRFRVRLEDEAGPLALLAALRMHTIEASIETALEGATESAKIITEVTILGE
jgi:hypothetical protein